MANRICINWLKECTQNVSRSFFENDFSKDPAVQFFLGHISLSVDNNLCGLDIYEAQLRHIVLQIEATVQIAASVACLFN